MNEDTVLPGVSVAGVDLAGLDRRAAERKIREALPDLGAGSLSLSVGAVNEGFEIVGGQLMSDMHGLPYISRGLKGPMDLATSCLCCVRLVSLRATRASTHRPLA